MNALKGKRKQVIVGIEKIRPLSPEVETRDYRNGIPAGLML